jgi:hypothetical protein
MLALALGLSCQDGSAAQQPSKSGKAPAASELDRLLAPIALYPDALLAQMLLCAGDPPKVTALSQWLRSHATLKGTELQDAATVDGFEPSFVALTLFPSVVDDMAKQLEWTSRLGKAFGADRTAVFDSIQRLRRQAQAAGSLKDTPQQDVETRATSGGQQVIVIEPANPQVIYVPQYNPQVVYTQPATTVVVEHDDDVDEAVAAGLIGFTAGIALGAAFDNDYYYGPWGWHGGAYMYNDAWDDWYDHREDAREDWNDHREDLVEERGERRGDAREQRTERVENRQGTGTERAENRQTTRTERTESRQTTRASGTSGTETRQTPRATGTESRGYSSGTQQASRERSGTRSDAFSGYSSGQSQRTSSARGQRSRGSSRGGGGRRR